MFAAERPKVKALFLISLLLVAEARRVQQTIHLHDRSQFSSGENGDLKREAEATVTKAGSQEHLQADQMTASILEEVPGPLQVMMREHGQLIREKIEAMMANPKLQEESKAFVEKMEAAMINSSSEHQATVVANHVEAMMADPTLQEAAKLIQEQLKAVLADPQLQEQTKLISRKIEAMKADPKLQEEALSFARRLETMVTDPKFQGHINNISVEVEVMMESPQLQARAELIGEQLKGMMAGLSKSGAADAEPQEQANSVADSLEAIMTDPSLKEHGKHVADIVEAMANDPSVEEHAKHVADHLEAIIADLQLQEPADILELVDVQKDKATMGTLLNSALSAEPLAATSLVELPGQADSALARTARRARRGTTAAVTSIGALLCGYLLATSGQANLAMMTAAGASMPAWQPALAFGLKYMMKPLIVIFMAYAYILQKLHEVYKKLPMNVVQMIFGLTLCFFGGTYFMSLAAIEAFRNFGGQRLYDELKVIYNEGAMVADANRRDDLEDRDRDGIADVQQMSTNELITHKARVAMKAVKDPAKLSNSLQYMFSAWLSVLATLKSEFARTVAIALGISEMVTPILIKTLGPILSVLMGNDLKHWVPAIIINSARVLAVIIASYVQAIISAFYSGMRGGRIFAESLLRFLDERGLLDKLPSRLVKKPFDPNTTYVDEAIAYPVAALGFMYQITHGFTLPFPWDLALLPLTIVEWFIRWEVFAR